MNASYLSYRKIMDDILFKRFYSKNMGISFFYDASLLPDDDSSSNDTNYSLNLRNKDLQFNLIKLSTEANVGLRIFGLEKGLKSSLGEIEILIEEVRTQNYEINGNKTAYTTSIYPSESGNIKIKRFLVSHDGQGYLLAFQNKVEQFESEESRGTFDTILDTFKFLK
ncbi:hypothetical protein NMY3_02623 [Candidatus Nitrosocosmicus oleophilus]|jgi:hypothetical protein|uniref:DUF1795 domain-containing protein n=1 Tax=Candidatus Nitrosocosmicus oleophilus TaxID=1353260 RepID=A0A654LZ43_9ARCH|nr:hypothetical protein [Candidatus Nitrosocosmicus oleophilus]ALI36814.1 hypothetical protein NMY3_02623 [Candidatus Nitrosocosmicus oleophilus]